MAILAIAKLREAVQEQLTRHPHKADSPLSLNRLLALLDAAEKIGLPEAKAPEYPRPLYGRYSGKQIWAGTPEKYDRLIGLGCWVEHPAEVEKFPKNLFHADSPTPLTVWNRWEESKAAQQGYKPDPKRTAPIYSRPQEAAGTWQSFMLTCDDPALLSFVKLRWEESARGPFRINTPSDANAGHLSDALSAYFFPAPKENENPEGE